MVAFIAGYTFHPGIAGQDWHGKTASPNGIVWT